MPSRSLNCREFKINFIKDFKIQFFIFCIIKIHKNILMTEKCEIFSFSFSVYLNSECFFLMCDLIHI